MNSSTDGDGLCSCEQVSHGDLGPVDPNERLARVVPSRHISKDGGVKTGLFPPSHIKLSGLSLMRMDKMTSEELIFHADVIAQFKTGDVVEGICVCITRLLREIVGDDGRRSLCVVDDPVENDPSLPDNPAHAIAIRSNSQGDDEIMRIRAELIMIFDGLTSIEEAS